MEPREPVLEDPAVQIPSHDPVHHPPPKAVGMLESILPGIFDRLVAALEKAIQRCALGATARGQAASRREPPPSTWRQGMARRTPTTAPGRDPPIRQRCGRAIARRAASDLRRIRERHGIRRAAARHGRRNGGRRERSGRRLTPGAMGTLQRADDRAVAVRTSRESLGAPAFRVCVMVSMTLQRTIPSQRAKQLRGYFRYWSMSRAASASGSFGASCRNRSRLRTASAFAPSEA